MKNELKYCINNTVHAYWSLAWLLSGDCPRPLFLPLFFLTCFLGCDKLGAFEEVLHSLPSDVRWLQWNNTERFPEVMTTGRWAFGELERYILDNCWAVFHRGSWGQLSSFPTVRIWIPPPAPAGPYSCHHQLLLFLLTAPLATFVLFLAVLSHTSHHIAVWKCLKFTLIIN